MSVTPPSSVSLQDIFSTAVTAPLKTAIAAGSRYRAEVPPGGGRRRLGRPPGRAAPHQVAGNIGFKTREVKVLPSESQELKSKISPRNLFNYRRAYFFRVFFFPVNDFECLTAAVCRRGEFPDAPRDRHVVFVSCCGTKTQSLNLTSAVRRRCLDPTLSHFAESCYSSAVSISEEVWGTCEWRTVILLRYRCVRLFLIDVTFTKTADKQRCAL